MKLPYNIGIRRFVVKTHFFTTKLYMKRLVNLLKTKYLKVVENANRISRFIFGLGIWVKAFGL